MADVHIGDDILHNILTRLPGKPLLRFRCVSMHWNRLISDPNFMKARSRRMILLAFPGSLLVIDDNVPVEDEAHSVVRIPFPFEHTRVSIIGTLNGIVVLAVYNSSIRCQLILYNPLTRKSKVLVGMDYKTSYVFGFGYGATTNDLKIVRFEGFKNANRFPMYKCDAFDLKTSSWSTSYFNGIYQFLGDVGVFINGFLYFYFADFGVEAFDVKEMVFETIGTPIHNYVPARLLLGSLDGCLCMVTNAIGAYTFDVWLMTEEGVWLKARSFRFGSQGNMFHLIGILGEGKILLKGRSSTQLVIYYTSKDSYKVLNDLATFDNCLAEDRLLYNKYPLIYARPIEYVESLVSPCFI